MVLKPEKEKEAEAIFRKWGLDFAIVGETTPTKRFIVRHGGDVMADLPIKELGDEAPEYKRPFVNAAKPAVIDAEEVKAPMGVADALEKLLAHAGSLLQALGVGAIRPHHSRQHRAAAGRRRRGGARRGRAEGPGAHHRRDAALLRGRSVRRRQAGGGGMLAQSDRRRRAAARGHRQSEFRQSGAAGDHGPVRRLRPRHRGGLQGARLPGRVRQCVALQRDQRPRDPADAVDRRRRPARRFHQVGDARLQARRRSDPADRRDHRLARPVDVSARASAAARRARRRRSI